jgi:hypothetical protein
MLAQFLPWHFQEGLIEAFIAGRRTHLRVPVPNLRELLQNAVNILRESLCDREGLEADRQS